MFLGAALPVVALVPGVGEVDAAAVGTDPDVVGGVEELAVVILDPTVRALKRTESRCRSKSCRRFRQPSRSAKTRSPAPAFLTGEPFI